MRGQKELNVGGLGGKKQEKLPTTWTGGYTPCRAHTRKRLEGREKHREKSIDRGVPNKIFPHTGLVQ